MKALFFPVVILCSIVSFGQDAGARKKNFNLSDGVGIKGYDPVAYFSQHKAIKGSKDLAVSFAGIAYYFSSVADQEEFRKNPVKYEPQYGGWCAYAMGKDGSKVEVDPETFKIIDGKLFLFYNQFFNNTLKSWNKDEANLHRQADMNWQKIFH
ncbi:MAG TPA: YHS domain-containing (seleno)protein [Puia sp.]|nr:YHS domain-containing (seleno)protein [Puia sp.]